MTPQRIDVNDTSRNKGRRNIAWLRSAGLVLAHPNALARRKKPHSLLFKTSWWLAACVAAAIALPNVYLKVLAVLGAIVFGLASGLSVIGLLGALVNRDT